MHGDTWHGGRANHSTATRRVIHLGFACVDTAPQYDIAGALTPASRARLGRHTALIPGSPESYGVPTNPFAGRSVDEITDSADVSAWESGRIMGRE